VLADHAEPHRILAKTAAPTAGRLPSLLDPVPLVAQPL